jgi:hypothetical protein
MQNIPLFRALFASRTDVFAIRWEKGTKNGYTPACQYDPYLYKKHKMGGGTYQNYADKTYLPLTDAELTKHFNGQQLIGVYPLLPDNTSWFIAADFDKDNWAEECRALLRMCADAQIPAYLERSRSGKGGHVWVFFNQPYPAIKSRRIFTNLLEKAGVISIFDKNSSFDRLFPNQDYLSGKGLGNLIALPFYKPTLEQGNSCFINPTDLVPFPDQWAFLSTIQKVGATRLDQLYEELNTTDKTIQKNQYPSTNTGKLSITLAAEVHISRFGITADLADFLKDTFNFANSAFFAKKNAGRSTWDTPAYTNLIRETPTALIVPRGSIGKIIRFCREKGIEYAFQDMRTKLPEVAYNFGVTLRPHQIPAIEAAQKKEMGVIVAPPGAGKTVMALKIIAEKQQPTLILVHRLLLDEQWTARIETFLNIPKKDIGSIKKGKLQLGKKITLATFQSLSTALEDNAKAAQLQSAFGLIIVDECHHVPAQTYNAAISKLNPFYLYGLTATPFRKYDDGKPIFLYLGDIIAELKIVETGHYNKPRITVRETDFEVPFNPKTDKFETLSKILVHDTARNNLILKDIAHELSQNRKVVVITERREHIDTLCLFLKQKYEVVSLSGEDSEANRADKWKILRGGDFQVLVTTGQFFGEGVDLEVFNAYFWCTLLLMKEN